MNGTRQPQDLSASGDRPRVTSAPTIAPSSSAAAWLAICQLPYRPRFENGAASIISAVELPNSPPAEKPCSRRPTTMMTGAPMPIAEYGGATASSAMPSVINAMTSESAALRPARSAYRPSTMPPTGRMKNATPKLAVVRRIDA